jgi:hypothetical protein
MALFYQMVPTLIGSALIAIACFVLLLIERRDARRARLRAPRASEDNRES